MHWESPDGDRRDAEFLDAVRRFVERHGTLPTALTWRAAAISPSERTIRRRFGNFKTALATALGSCSVHSLTAVQVGRRPPTSEAVS